ncbi:chitinase-3-like protein 1 [Galendromus occidentalis]|uniref:Chitinase-3-like protein 1 n=1 Tax=Galendromus occidentalis TaxID=34638 RepID=A0AAJ6QU04_9ACAR|nr:chitinase-3-like protein 1 [Galendromus occidentalis]
MTAFGSPISGISCYYRYDHRVSSLDDDTLRKVGCSHIIVGFATVSADSKVNLSDVGGEDGLRGLVREIKTPKRRVMLSIGGGGGDRNFDEMSSKLVNLKSFLASLVEIVRFTGLDGVDYDWEFPSFHQQDDLNRLLRETRHVFDNLTAEESSADVKRLDLSVALPGPVTLTAAYNASVLKETCTFFNVMTYDLALYSSWHPIATFHNALYGQGSFLSPLRLFSVSTSMRNWVNLGLPASMLLLGIPTYGVAYELSDPLRTSPLAPIKGYSRLGANLNYDEICRITTQYPEGNHFDERSRVPYASDGNGTWISYDNIRSVVEKVEFATREGFGGIMIFSLNADDPFGNCALNCSDGLEDCLVQASDRSNGFPLSQVAIATLEESPNGSR